MAKRHIALAIWTLTISGGGARQLLELALGLERKGYSVDIFTTVLDAQNCYPDLLKNLSVYSLNKDAYPIYPLAKYPLWKKAVYAPFHFLNKRRNLYLLKELIQKHDKEKKYIAFNYHETEIEKLCRFFPKEKNFWMLNDLYIGGESIIESIFRIIDNFLFQYLYKPHIQQIIVLDYMNKALVKKHLHTNATVIRSGIDQKKFYYKKTYSQHPTLSILATGIFFPHRRYEDIVEAINILVTEKKLTTIQVNIIGQQNTDKIYAQKIIDMIEDKNLTKYIKLLGRVSEKELQTTYRTADIFIFPNTPQTWGLAVFEAMLCGAVAIVSRGAGAHEVIKQKESGIIVDGKSPKQIAEAIIYLKNNPKKLKEIAIQGQNYVLHNLSWDKYTQDMLTVFTKS